MRRDAERVRNETSGISPGPSRHRDGVGTGHGTSHNSIPPSRPCLEAWEGWSMPVPQHLVLRNKGRRRGGADQDSDMPSAVELTAAIAVANDALATLVWQQAQAKEREEQEVKELEEQEAKDTPMGSFSLGHQGLADLRLARLANVPLR